MKIPKSWKAVLVLVIPALILPLLPACDGAGTPTPKLVEWPTFTPRPEVRPLPTTVRQELQDQHDMLRALVEAERGRGKDVSQAAKLLDEADSALKSEDLALAREKLREAGKVLGVDLP